MLLIMQIADQRPMNIKTVAFVEIELSLPTFLRVFEGFLWHFSFDYLFIDLHSQF